MIFWTIAAVMAASVTTILLLALLRGRNTNVSPAEFDLRVYRDQLEEVEKDLARGVIGTADAERVRTEISRRILSADTQLKASTSGIAQPQTAARVMAGLVVLVLLGGGFALYAQMGQPGYGDMPLNLRKENAQTTLETRSTQAEYEATLPPSLPPEIAPEFAELMEKLRKTVSGRPDDLQGQTLLARNEASLGNTKAAYIAQGHVVRLKGADVTAQDLTIHASMMVEATQGYVSPEAEKSLRAALKLEPRNSLARYYLGLMLAQNDRPDMAFRIWEKLLKEGPADAPWIAPIRRGIQDLAWRAGTKFTLPEIAPLKGPSAADVDASTDMTEEDRQGMIQGMVTQLAERLSTKGGPPSEWARLILAYSVLGAQDKAVEIWAEAQTIFAQNPQALETVRIAAEQAGVAQ